MVPKKTSSPSKASSLTDSLHWPTLRWPGCCYHFVLPHVPNTQSGPCPCRTPAWMPCSIPTRRLDYQPSPPTCVAPWRTWFAQRLHGAYWACWVDATPSPLAPCPVCARALTLSLEGSGLLPHALSGLREAFASLQAVGFEPPPWSQALTALPPALAADDAALDFARRWQRHASRAIDDFCHRAIRRDLEAPDLAMLDSQAGPHAACIFVTRPVAPVQHARLGKVWAEPSPLEGM